MPRLDALALRMKRSPFTKCKTLHSSKRTKTKSSNSNKSLRNELIRRRETTDSASIEEATRVTSAVPWSPWTTTKIHMTTQPCQSTMEDLACRETMYPCQMTCFWEVDRVRWSRETSLPSGMARWMSITLELSSQIMRCKTSTEVMCKLNNIMVFLLGKIRPWIHLIWQWVHSKGSSHSLSKAMPITLTCKPTITQTQWWITCIHQTLVSLSINRLRRLLIKTVLPTIWEISTMFRGVDLMKTKTMSCTRPWMVLMEIVRAMKELSDRMQLSRSLFWI